MTFGRLTRRLTIGTFGCLVGVVCCGIGTVALPALDLTVPLLTKSGHKTRRSLAWENFRIFARFTRDFAMATVNFRRRDQLNALIR